MGSKSPTSPKWFETLAESKLEIEWPLALLKPFQSFFQFCLSDFFIIYCRSQKMDKSWMKLKDRVSDEYRVGVNAFIEFATASVGSNGKIRCPCANCMNISYLDINVVKYHIFLRGMSSTYTTWLHHGETVATISSNI